MTLIRPIIMLVALALLFPSAVAQEEAAEASEETQPAQILVVSVGPKPARKFGNKGQMLLPSAGETPPATLYFKGKSATDKKPDWQAFSVPFNNPSALKSTSSEKALVLHRKNKESGSYEEYVTIPPGAVGSRRVFFLIPATTGMKLWDKPPLVRTIDLNAKTLQGKQFILKNLSTFSVLHAFEDSVTAVPSMKTISYTRPKSGELYRLAARYGTQKKIIYNTAVRLDSSGNIQLFALYNANPKTNSGRSVGVFRMMIPVTEH